MRALALFLALTITCAAQEAPLSAPAVEKKDFDKEYERRKARIAQPAPQSETQQGTSITLTPEDRAVLQTLPVAMAQCVGSLKLQMPDDICTQIVRFLSTLAERAK